MSDAFRGRYDRHYISLQLFIHKLFRKLFRVDGSRIKNNFKVAYKFNNSSTLKLHKSWFCCFSFDARTRKSSFFYATVEKKRKMYIFIKTGQMRLQLTHAFLQLQKKYGVTRFSPSTFIAFSLGQKTQVGSPSLKIILHVAT